jgi:hypothetical protein
VTSARSASRASEPGALAAGVRAGDRRALAKAITLVESSRPDHQDAAQRLLELLLPDTGRAARIGVSGVPGVGKSTFIEAFGLHLLARGLRVAVLAVEPSSARSGGSILGDKTRMSRLSVAPEAFIRRARRPARSAASPDGRVAMPSASRRLRRDPRRDGGRRPIGIRRRLDGRLLPRAHARWRRRRAAGHEEGILELADGSPSTRRTATTSPAPNGRRRTAERVTPVPAAQPAWKRRSCR